MNICLVLIEYPVSHINGKYASDFAGGAGVVMYDIAHGLRSRGHNVTVVARTIYPDHAGSFWDKGINVHKFYSRSREQETVIITNFLHEVIKTNEIEIVETCDYAPLVCEMPDNIPLLIRQHISHGLINLYKGTTSTAYDKNDLECSRRSFQLHLGDSFSGVSNFILREQARFHGISKERIYGVIYNGIRNIEPGSNEKNKRVLFCHGTVSKRKGTDKVCRIYDQVKKIDPSVGLRVIGHGRDFWEGSCVREMNTIAQKDCFYSEYLPHGDAVIEVARYGIYISMSNLEAMSISLIEALRLGKPAILFKNGSFDEIIEDGLEGFLVETEDEAVGRIIEILGSETLYDQMSLAAIKKSRQFTIDKCVSETESWYTTVLRNKEEILSKRCAHFHELLKEYYRSITTTTIV